MDDPSVVPLHMIPCLERALKILLHPELVLVVAAAELALFLHCQAHILSTRKAIPVGQRWVLTFLHAIKVPKDRLWPPSACRFL